MPLAPWSFHILAPIFREAFKPRDATPVPLWAKKKVFLSRRITTKPGFYDVEEFNWTYESQDIFRTRRIYERQLPDGATVICDGPLDGARFEDVRQVTWMKSSVAGVTEGALNGIRWICENDPHNIIFSIDSRVEAGTINEVRLQPTLRQLGETIFSDPDEDAGKFLPRAAKEFEWRRKGANHWGDAVKNAIIGYRWLTRDSVEPTRAPTTPEELSKLATLLAVVLSDAPPDALS